MRRTLAAACALTIGLVVVAAPTQAASKQSAATLCVGGKKCYATIQAAVDAATDGDTITIGPGTITGGIGVRWASIQRANISSSLQPMPSA